MPELPFDMMAVGMAMAFGAGGGAILASYLHIAWLTMPLLFVGGILGAAAGAGAFGGFDVLDVFNGLG